MAVTLNEYKRKKIHVVDDICFVIIDKDLVKQLRLNGNEMWVEQCIVENGISLKIICNRRSAD